MKTSDFPYAAALTGPEPVGVVQDETNVQTSVQNISYVVPKLPYVKVGYTAGLYGFSSIAIGADASAVGSTSTMAIGAASRATGEFPVTIGSPAYVSHDYATVVGCYNFVVEGHQSIVLGAGNESGQSSYGTMIGAQNQGYGDYIVAIGRGIGEDGHSDRSVKIGQNFSASNSGLYPPESIIAIGDSITTYRSFGVAIGVNAPKVTYKGISIGVYAGFQNQNYNAAGNKGIAIGYMAYVPVAPGIAIGSHTLGVYNGTALGTEVSAFAETVAIGMTIDCQDDRSVGIGYRVKTSYGSVALGTAYAYQPYSMVLGAFVIDPYVGAFVNTGVPISSLLRPVVFHEKFIGSTISPKNATASWGGEGYTATVTYDTVGAIGNNYVLNVADNGADESLAIELDEEVLSILLATNDPSTNTLLNIAGLFPSNGFSFGYTSGFDDSVLSFTFTSNFAGGVDGTPAATLTADGNSPTENNQPAIYDNSLATLTATVIGTTPDIFESSGDTARFTLAPVLVLRNENNYTFIGSSTLTLGSHTSGASDWDVPTLTIVDDTQLQLSVTNSAVDVDWMAHLVFEASENTTDFS